jgi:hypothetical protein
MITKADAKAAGASERELRNLGAKFFIVGPFFTEVYNEQTIVGYSLHYAATE